MSLAEVLTGIMIAGGLVLIAAGGRVLWMDRRRDGGATGPENGLNGQPRPSRDRGLSGLSIPTRLSLAVVPLVVGYHLVAWGVPAAWGSPVAFPRQWWPAVVGGGAAWAGLSVLLDRLENRRGS